ncbi:hypothetical protein N9A28_08910 [Sulfurimonas sp.]|nr:hypothetical protein [Sulfurimonas sp.]
MSKIIQALLTGMFFTFFLDFFLFLGIKINYIDLYEIDLYYNILFADHQNIYLFMTLSVIFGYLVIYVKNSKVSISVIGFLSILVLSTLIEDVGNKVGEDLLMSKDRVLRVGKFNYEGDIVYNGRNKISFYDYQLKKIITLDKNKLKGQDR